MYPIDFFYRAVQRHPEALALLGPGDVRLSYKQLEQRVRTLAAAMQACDPAPQSRVAICAGNHAEHIVALLATLAAGKVWVPLNVRSTSVEIERILQSVTPSIVIVDATGQAIVPELAATTRWGLGQTGIDSIADVSARCAQAPIAPIETGRDGTQAIKFTGGTTGAPKGVMQPYRAWNACIMNQIHGWGMSAGDRYVVCAPITHGTSTYVLPVLAQGGCLVFPETNAPADIAAAFEVHRGTMSFMPPTLIYMLMSSPDVRVEQFESLRCLVFGGAPMPPEKIDEARAFFGDRIGSTYGQTESPQIVTMILPHELADPANRGSCGRCTWLSDVAIMSPDGQMLPVGQKGEVVVGGDLVMTGYWQMPDKTSETIIDGWLHTGDVGYLDDRGFLYIKDRLRDVVITGGFNVYPVDVEDALCKHPAVYEASVFGMPHDKWGEAVHAAVQLHPGTDVSVQVLMEHVKALLGGVHTPKYVHFMELPRSSVGKVLKKDIRQRVGNQISSDTSSASAMGNE